MQKQPGDGIGRVSWIALGLVWVGLGLKQQSENKSMKKTKKMAGVLNTGVLLSENVPSKTNLGIKNHPLELLDDFPLPIRGMI